MALVVPSRARRRPSRARERSQAAWARARARGEDGARQGKEHRDQDGLAGQHGVSRVRRRGRPGVRMARRPLGASCRRMRRRLTVPRAQLLLHDDQEPDQQRQQADAQEVRPDRAQARPLPGVQDANIKGRSQGVGADCSSRRSESPRSRCGHGRRGRTHVRLDLALELPKPKGYYKVMAGKYLQLACASKRARAANERPWLARAYDARGSCSGPRSCRASRLLAWSSSRGGE